MTGARKRSGSRSISACSSCSVSWQGMVSCSNVADWAASRSSRRRRAAAERAARRGPQRHLVQPGSQRVAHPEAAGLAHQNQESGLKGILRVVRIGQYAPANAQDHRPMPLDQGGERLLGRIAPLGREPLEKLAVGQLTDRADREECAKLPHDAAILSQGHGLLRLPATVA